MTDIQFVPTTKNNIIALQGSPYDAKDSKEEFVNLDGPESPENRNYYPARYRKKVDPVFHFYLGSMSVVGLFILFRMIQKN
jgi:hypothetical protein